MTILSFQSMIFHMILLDQVGILCNKSAFSDELDSFSPTRKKAEKRKYNRSGVGREAKKTHSWPMQERADCSGEEMKEIHLPAFYS
jgi:hypothetical protein